LACCQVSPPDSRIRAGADLSCTSLLFFVIPSEPYHGHPARAIRSAAKDLARVIPAEAGIQGVGQDPCDPDIRRAVRCPHLTDNLVRARCEVKRNLASK
jgi:hypothetical protein